MTPTADQIRRLFAAGFTMRQTWALARAGFDVIGYTVVIG